MFAATSTHEVHAGKLILAYLRNISQFMKQLHIPFSVPVFQMLCLTPARDIFHLGLTKPSEEWIFLSFLNIFVVFSSKLTGFVGCVC